MSMTSYITEKSIAQGDLVLILNSERPTKSGWWRKIREGMANEQKVYYVLEKPMHKDFNKDDSELQCTHKEDDLFVMKYTTLQYAQKYDKTKYDVLVDVRGTDAINLVLCDYDLNSLILNSKNINYTENFLKLMEYYNKSERKMNHLEEMANNFI